MIHQKLLVSAITAFAMAQVTDLAAQNSAQLSLPWKDRGQNAKSNTCVNGDIGDRSRVYNQIGLTATTNDFSNYIKLKPANNEVSITYVPVHIKRTHLVAIADAYRAVKGVAVDGIQVNYGIVGTTFFPVFQFLFADPSLEPQLFKDDYFKYVQGIGFLPMVKKDAEDIIEKYRSSIRLNRSGTGFSEFIREGANVTNADPYAEWFRFSGELNLLFLANPIPDQHLVLNCISEKACYSSLGFKEGVVDPIPEYRHLIAWNVSNGTVNELDTTRIENSAILKNRAMDLGHLCPPRCK